MGFVIAMTMLLFAVQLIVFQLATTSVRTAAWDGARMVARTPERGTGPGDDRIRGLLPNATPTITWAGDGGEAVEVTVSVDLPGVVPFGLLKKLRVASATAVVRSEQWQA
jgi:hypothetical protein